MKKSQKFLGISFVLAGVVYIISRFKYHNILGDADPSGPNGNVDITAGKSILMTEAFELTKKYQETYTGNVKNNYCNLIAITELIETYGTTCVGLRIYRAHNLSNMQGIVIVGVDEKGDDLPNKAIGSFEKCPDNCNYNSVLLH